MASLSYWLGTWVSGGPQDDLGPGETHNWFAWGFFDYGGAISLTAHPGRRCPRGASAGRGECFHGRRPWGPPLVLQR